MIPVLNWEANQDDWAWGQVEKNQKVKGKGRSRRSKAD